MVFICHVEDLTSVFFGFQEVSKGKLVELLANRVGGDAEFLGKLPEIRSCLRVEEKADKELDTSL